MATAPFDLAHIVSLVGYEPRGLKNGMLWMPHSLSSGLHIVQKSNTLSPGLASENGIASWDTVCVDLGTYCNIRTTGESVDRGLPYYLQTLQNVNTRT